MDLRIASPCRESWDDMRGDESVRHCERCSLNVYNLSAMREDQVAELIQRTEGRICARFYQRLDGTVMTADCPVGRREKLVARFSWAAVAAIIVTLVASLGLGINSARTGKVEWMHAVMRWLGLEEKPAPPPVLMGKVRYTVPPPPPAAPPAPLPPEEK